MPSLTSFSLLDDQRSLINLEETSAYPGRKIMTYSALKIAIIAHAFEKKMTENFQCSLVELKVVDRSLNPEYILQSCPNLKNLEIDWQEEWAQVPYQNYPQDWFSKCLKNPSWSQLLLSLTSLKITFPAFHSESGYSCPAQDFAEVIKYAKNLTHLTLKGMVNQGHITICDFLYLGPNLQERSEEHTSELQSLG